MYMDAMMKEVKMGMRRRGVIFLEEGRYFKLPGLLYAEFKEIQIMRKGGTGNSRNWKILTLKCYVNNSNFTLIFVKVRLA